ncbi:hypothetical protein RP20_CCG003601 [Aedes albopictus]|nr:hypothetical protein RP20_CCG003601 [Aedes albopictus]
MDWHYCQDMSLDKPYCNNGECSTTPEFIENCPYIFKYCIGSGYYPDPYSCDIYHFCEEKDTASSVYKCPKNYVFNPETNLCKRQLQESDCMKVECSPGVTFSAYGTSKRFFGYCRYSSGPYPYEKEIHRCPEGTEFTGKKCAFQCPAEGRFANTSNERGYYECYYSDDEELVAVSQMCPADKVYSAELSTCIQQVTTTPATTTGL